MYMIVGLGNPGRQYENTRHNCGFETLDFLMKEYGVTLTEDRCRAYYGKCIIEGVKSILVKPQTYMNLSGDAIRGLADYYKIEPQNIIVICDDINLAPGQIRVRPKGSAGGHNGLKDIIAKLGTEGFIRIRVGVGEKPQGWDLADHVLGHFSAEEGKLMKESMKNAADAVKMIVGGESVDKVMSRFNTKKQTQPA